MIIANPPKHRKFSLAFTIGKFIPEEFIKNPLKPCMATAKINHKEVKIEIHDVLKKHFKDLQLIDMLITAGTDLTSETVSSGLVQRYGKAIRNSMIHVVLFKVTD